jgi:hypothetical protein
MKTLERLRTLQIIAWSSSRKQENLFNRLYAYALLNGASGLYPPVYPTVLPSKSLQELGSSKEPSYPILDIQDESSKDK